MNCRVLYRKPNLASLVAAALAVSVVACGDLTGVPASLPTISDSSTAYALNGAPPNAPTSLHIYTGQLFAADANFLFDVAFDLDAGGNPVILPQRVVASGLAATHSVGLQTSTSTFESITRAPASGYRADSALVVKLNQPVLIQSNDPNACGVSLTGTNIYAKLVVRAIDATARKLTVVYTVDPNCGFRSFLPGVPKD